MVDTERTCFATQNKIPRLSFLSHLMTVGLTVCIAYVIKKQTESEEKEEYFTLNSSFLELKTEIEQSPEKLPSCKLKGRNLLG